MAGDGYVEDKPPTFWINGTWTREAASPRVFRVLPAVPDPDAWACCQRGGLQESSRTEHTVHVVAAVQPSQDVRAHSAARRAQLSCM